MNERIQELAKQAGIHAEYTPGMIPLLEKFAESLIMECIEQLETGKRCDPYTGELFVCQRNDDIDFDIANLKQHFGVEG